MLAELFDKLIQDDRAPQVVDLVKVETDAERVARYAAKVEEAKRLLGDKYLCHESKRVAPSPSKPREFFLDAFRRARDEVAA